MTESSKTLIVEIGKFEEFVFQRNFDDAITSLLQILTMVESGTVGFGGSAVSLSVEAEVQATRLCSAITDLFRHKDFKLTSQSFLQLTRFKRAMSQVFEISGYRGTRHFTSVMGTATANGGRSLAQYETLKLLTILSINSMTPELVGLLLKQDKRVGLQLVSAFLSEQITYSPTAEAARNAIFDNAKHWEGVEFTPAMVRNLGPAYMGCSYAEADNKHDIKRTFNDVVQRWLKENGVKNYDVSQPRQKNKERPTVLVVAELYHSKHAMHRCYGPSLRALKERFNLVLMTLDGTCEEVLLDLFDEIDDTAFDYSAPWDYINRIHARQPDIVYFPSVGMRLSSILASNVRFAPIQLMTFGHPATTHSSAVDYAIMGEGQVGAPETVNEKILCHLSEPRFVMRDDAEAFTPDVRTDPSTVRLAVPAWSRKVTPTFIKACEQIRKRSPKPVEFWFFPNGAGALYQGFKRRFESLLPAKVFPRTNYNTYMENLNQCDIFLSSFPFGATNGIVDAACLGLPIVNMTGPEMHAANDGDLVSYIDAPDWLTTKSVDEYVAAVLRLIEDDDLRVRLSREMIDRDPAACLLLPEDSKFESFADAVEAAYLCHEQIQAQDKHVWNCQELESLVTAHKAEAATAAS